MIESSYEPINGNSPPESPSSNQPTSRLLQRIQNIDRSFIVSKLFYFFFYTALGALFPFFSLYYKQLWLSASQIGILIGLRPAVKVVCLPLWKMVTDKYSKPRAVYFISIFGWLIGYYGQTLVSPDNIPCYDMSTSAVANNNQSVFNLSLHDMAPREWNQPVHSPIKNIFNKNKVYIRDSELSLGNKLSSLSRNEHKDTLHQSQSTRLRNWPHKQLLDEKPDHNKGQLFIAADDKEQNDKHLKISEQNTERNSVGSQDDMNMQQGSGDYTRSKSPKPKDDFRVRYNYWMFRTLAVIIILTEIITSPTPMLADSAVIQSLTDTDNDYGKQRLFGCLGLAISASLVAVWVSKSTHCQYTDTIDYKPCFNIFLIAIGVTIFVSLFFKFEAPDRGEEDYKLLEAIQIFKTPRHGFFLFTMFALGFAHSLQITFLFWFLQDIGGSPVLFALMILVYCVSEVVMYFVVGYIIQAIGVQRTLAIAIACYAARFLMYSSLNDPWLVIPMELVQGMTYGGVWMVAGMYIKAPQGS